MLNPGFKMHVSGDAACMIKDQAALPDRIYKVLNNVFIDKKNAGELTIEPGCNNIKNELYNFTHHRFQTE